MKKLSLLMAILVAFSSFYFPAFAEDVTEEVAEVEIAVSEIENDEIDGVEIENAEIEDFAADIDAEEAELLGVDFAVLDETANAIIAEMLTTSNEPAHMVTRNLDMSLDGDLVIPEGVTVSFRSGDETIIANDGTVERSFEEDKTVSVFVTVSAGDEGVEKELKFTVLKADTLVLYSENFYYPDKAGEELVGYSSNAYTSLLPGSWKFGPFTQNPASNVSAQIKAAEGEYLVDYKRVNTAAGTEMNLFVPIRIDANSPNYSKIKFSMTLRPVAYTASTQRIDFALLARNAKLIDWFSFKSGSIQNNLSSPTENITQQNTGFKSADNNKIDVIVDYEAGTYTTVMNGKELSAMRLPSGMETLKLNYMTIGLARWQVNPAEFYLKDIAVTTVVDLENVESIGSMINEGMFNCENSESVLNDFSFKMSRNLTAYLEEKGITVSFKSDSDLIAVDGHNFIVTPSETKEEVTLTASVSDGENVCVKEFVFKVYNPASIIIEKITTDNFSFTDALKIKEDFSFIPGAEVEELVWFYGAEIKLESNSAAIEFDGYDAVITKTEDARSAEITVTVTAGNISVEKVFSVTVNNILLTDIFSYPEPIVTDNGSSYNVNFDITCVDSVEPTAQITLVVVLVDKSNGKIADIGYDTKTIASGASEQFSIEVDNLGEGYECKYYLWNNMEDAVPVKNAPPAEPASAEVSDLTTGSGLISWNKADDDGKAVVSYNIYRAGNLIGSTRELNYLSENLDFGTEYLHSVKSVDEAGNESVEGKDVILKTKNIPTVTLKSDNPEQPGKVQNASELTLITSDTKSVYMYNEPAEIGGRVCRKTTKCIRADGTVVISMFFFKADHRYITPNTKNIAIEVTFFDQGTATIINESQGGGGGNYRLTNTGCWKTHTFIINSAAYTSNGLYDSANFRFYTQGAENFHVYQTSISRLDEYRQPAASFKVEDVIVLRDVLYFAADNQATVTEIGERTAAMVENGKYIELDFEEIRIDSGKSEVTVEIEYFDNGTDDINLEYSSTGGPKTYSFARTNTGKWMTKIVKFSDAKFNAAITGVTNRKVDMRVSGANETIYVKSVKAY